MQRFLLAILTFLFLTQLACGYRVQVNPPWKKADTQAEPVVFIKENCTALLDSAKAHQQAVFIDFYATWCAPCKVMDREVFAGSEAAAFLNIHFLNLKIDGERGEGKALMKEFRVRAYPTLVFIGKDGKEVRRHEGLMTASQTLSYAQRTLK